MLKAELLVLKKEYTEAIQLLDILIEKKTLLDRLYYLKARAHNFKGENKEAIAAIKKALSISPNNSIALFLFKVTVSSLK